jgi:hypothetical protein
MSSIKSLADQQHWCLPKELTPREDWKECIVHMFKDWKRKVEVEVKRLDRISSDEKRPHGIVLDAQEKLKEEMELLKRLTQYLKWAEELN